MARSPGPVRPLRKHERKYDRALRRAVLEPLFRDLREGLADAVSITQVYRAADAAVEAAVVRGVPIELIRKSLASIDTYHRARIIKSFGAALGIDIGYLLTNPQIEMFMRRKIGENVDLISTIPPRMHAGLTRKLQDEFRAAPFDRQRLTRVVREEYGSTGYNLRRIVRDQSTKMTGELTEIRQRQMGVEGYKWSTSSDERVRDAHRANDGKFFRWDNPPAETGHPGADVQCRCVAIPALTRADRERLKQGASQTPAPAPPPRPVPSTAKPSVPPFVGSDEPITVSPGGGPGGVTGWSGPSIPPKPPKLAVPKPPAQLSPTQTPAPVRPKPNLTPTAAQSTKIKAAHKKIGGYQDESANRFVKRYTQTQDYAPLNRGLRSGGPLPDKLKTLNAGMHKSLKPLGKDVRVFRGEHEVFTKNIPIKVGQEVSTQAWTSTSTLPGNANSFSSRSGRVWDIRAPKGARAIVTNASEGEVILPPNARLKIIGIEPMNSDGKERIIAEVLT